MGKLKLALALAGVALAAAPTGACALAGVSVGHSGWLWSSPLPQGNALAALDFAGDRGYAAGAFGTLLRSDDGGQSWVGLGTGVTEDLSRVQAISADAVVLAGGCIVRRSDDGGQSFRRLPWTGSESRCRSQIVGLAFPTSDTGYLVREDGRFYRSGDGGASWNRMADVPATPAAGGASPATDAAFVEPDTGLVTTSAGIFRTVDGGVYWSQVSARAGGVDAVALPGPHAGYAVGEGGAAYRTVDGGQSWSSTGPLPGAPSLGAIDCANPARCLTTAADGGRLLRTTNGGVSWS